jgi:hypothetical protein
MDFSNFPHPDKSYPHPMEKWPVGVVLPVSVELGECEVEDAVYSTCEIVMPNGDRLVVVQYGDSAFDAEAETSGNWATLQLRDRHWIFDMAVETICQAEMTASEASES